MPNGAPGEEGGVLKDEGDELAGVLRSHAVDGDVAGGDGAEAGDQLEESGFAAAGGADDGDELAALRWVVMDSRTVAVAPLEVLEAL